MMMLVLVVDGWVYDVGSVVRDWRANERMFERLQILFFNETTPTCAQGELHGAASQRERVHGSGHSRSYRYGSSGVNQES